MGTKLTYALALAGSGAVFRLLLYFTGFETEKLSVGQHLNWLMLPVSIAILWFGIKAVREERPHGAISYGQAVGAGTLISLISSVFSAIYTFIHLKFINTSFVDYQMEVIRGKWAEAGLGDAQMEQAEAMTRAMMSPGLSAGMAIVMGVIFGVILSLVIAAFLKKPLPAGAEPPL